MSEEELATDAKNQSEQATMLQEIATSLKPWTCSLGASVGDQREAAKEASAWTNPMARESCSQSLKQLECDLAKDT